MRRSTVPIRRARSMPMRAMRRSLGALPGTVNAMPATTPAGHRGVDHGVDARSRADYSRCQAAHTAEELEPDPPFVHAIPEQEGVMADVKREKRPTLSRRRFLGGALGATAALPVMTRRVAAQAKPTITYWNGLTGADGKVMDGLIDQFTSETGIKIEQQRILWP